MKKHIIGSILVTVLIMVGVAISIHSKPYKTISQNGFSFSYPKELMIQEISSSEGNYMNYEIHRPLDVRHPESRFFGQSTITVSIPLKNSSMPSRLSDYVENFGGDPSKIIPIKVNGHEGYGITLRVDRYIPGDVPTVPATVVQQELKSRYLTSPVNLQYFKTDTDASLDKAWEIIQKTLRY